MRRSCATPTEPALDSRVPRRPRIHVRRDAAIAGVLDSHQRTAERFGSGRFIPSSVTRGWRKFFRVPRAGIGWQPATASEDDLRYFARPYTMNASGKFTFVHVGSCSHVPALLRTVLRIEK